MEAAGAVVGASTRPQNAEMVEEEEGEGDSGVYIEKGSATAEEGL